MKLKKLLNLPYWALNSFLVKNFYKKPIHLNTRHPLVSFTFDDFPLSASSSGAGILDRYKAKGTFYTSLGLMNSANHLGQHFGENDLKRLLLDGHEIGSHTFSHINTQNVSQETLILDLNKNQEEAKKLSNRVRMENFSYPFGAIDLKAKKIINSRFKSARSIFPGINHGLIDLNLLKGNKLYNGIPIEQIRELILKNTAKKGWLIFYTHDIRDNPSQYGCTPQYFEKIVDLVLKSGSEILSIAEVLALHKLNN